jgi:hypothetical protein
VVPPPGVRFVDRSSLQPPHAGGSYAGIAGSRKDVIAAQEALRAILAAVPAEEDNAEERGIRMEHSPTANTSCDAASSPVCPLEGAVASTTIAVLTAQAAATNWSC